MFNASRLRRSAILGALACALLAAPTTAVAAAQPNGDGKCRVQLGAGLPMVPCPNDPGSNELAQERYYSSYGEPEPIIAPVAPAPSDETPWLTIALAATAALSAASIAAMQRRRLRLRRRVVRAAS